VDATARLWLVFAIWAIAVLGFFTVSPFKLPHYGLPAFPALALFAARAWDEAIGGPPEGGGPEAVRPRQLMAPLLVVFGVAAVAIGIASAGLLPFVQNALGSVDVATRNVTAQGGVAPSTPIETWRPLLVESAVVFALAAGGMAIALRRGSPRLGVGVALAAMIAFLPVAGRGLAEFARTRSARPVVEALARRLQSDDVVVHEGPLEDSASALLVLDRPVKVVNGLASNLAFGATFPDARGIFWEASRLRAEWTMPGRRFLLSVVPESRSVVRTLPASSVHLIAHAGGRWLYSNQPDVIK
jgi:4-amino-4-deoxy-L-arabinose transferase-like glycosyltransferase